MNRPILSGPSENVAIIQMVDGNGSVQNVNVNASTGQDHYFSGRVGVTLPNLRCKVGSANPDSVCVCPASMNSSPFVPYPEQYRKAYFDELFAPMDTSTPVTPAARHIADRLAMPIRQ